MTTVNGSNGPQPLDTYAANNTSSMSTDELLILFSQASDSNQVAEQGIKDRITAGINAKKANGLVQTEIQHLNFTGDPPRADASKVKAQLQNAIDTCQDPGAKYELQKQYDQYFGPNNDGTKDNLVSKEEADALGRGLDTASSSIDDSMQILTLNLKQAEEKFQQITAIIKEIMDAKNKVTTSITQNV